MPTLRFPRNMSRDAGAGSTQDHDDDLFTQPAGGFTPAQRRGIQMRLDNAQVRQQMTLGSFSCVFDGEPARIELFLDRFVITPIVNPALRAFIRALFGNFSPAGGIGVRRAYRLAQVRSYRIERLTIFGTELIVRFDRRDHTIRMTRAGARQFTNMIDAFGFRG